MGASRAVVVSSGKMAQTRIEWIEARVSAGRKSRICERIPRDLPGWFGIEEATWSFIAGVAEKDMIVTVEDDGDAPVGFLSLVHHNRFTSEIYVIGVKRAAHRQGIGTKLVETAVLRLRDRQTEFLMVKTLGPSHPNEGYRRTRQQEDLPRCLVYSCSRG